MTLGELVTILGTAELVVVAFAIVAALASGGPPKRPKAAREVGRKEPGVKEAA